MYAYYSQPDSRDEIQLKAIKRRIHVGCANHFINQKAILYLMLSLLQLSEGTRLM